MTPFMPALPAQGRRPGHTPRVGAFAAVLEKLQAGNFGLAG